MCNHKFEDSKKQKSKNLTQTINTRNIFTIKFPKV